MRTQYAIQPKLGGLAERFWSARSSLGATVVALIGGDNIFCGQALQEKLATARDELCLFR